MIEITITKKHILALTVVLLSFSAASTVDIRDSVTNIYGEINVYSDLTVGQGDGALRISEDNSNISLTPRDEGSFQEDNQLKYNLDENTWDADTFTIEGETAATEEYVETVIPASTYTGSGRDGEVTNSGSKIIQATNYTVTSRQTVNTGNQLVVFARDEIEINGEINADGAGAAGGDGGSGNEVPGDSGNDGHLSGNDVGGGRIYNDTQIENFDFFFSPSWDPVFERNIIGGAGGDGGTSGDYQGETGEGGGKGGRGGGTVILVAPKIDINGEISAKGGKGNDGTDGTCDYDEGGEGGDGGNGGSGGGVILAYTQLENSGNINVTGGPGGEGGAEGNCEDDVATVLGGSDGAQGSDGMIRKIDLS